MERDERNRKQNGVIRGDDMIFIFLFKVYSSTKNTWICHNNTKGTPVSPITCKIVIYLWSEVHTQVPKLPIDNVPKLTQNVPKLTASPNVPKIEESKFRLWLLSGGVCIACILAHPQIID